MRPVWPQTLLRVFKVCCGHLYTNTCACGSWPYSMFLKRNCRAVRCGSSPILSVFLPFDLHRGVVQDICTAVALHPWQPVPQSSQAKICSAKEQHNPMAMSPLRERLCMDTTCVCFDFALPLVFAGIWESAAGSESKAAVIGIMNSPAVKDREPQTGNTVSEPDIYFFTILHAPWVSTGNQSVCPSGLPIMLFRELMLTWMGECGYKAVTKWPV